MSKKAKKTTMKLAELQVAFAEHTKQPQKVEPQRLLTFALSSELCKASTTVASDGTERSIVMLRNMQMKKVKGPKGRVETIVEFSKWRVFPGARKATDILCTTQFICIEASLEAWSRQGLIDQIVERDTPREKKTKHDKWQDVKKSFPGIEKNKAEAAA